MTEAAPPLEASRYARVLVVDDEPDLRTLYELTLLREGHHVTCAADLAAARACLANQAFDVVLTDMRLPDGTGLQLLSELTTQDRRERTVVITAYGSAENAVEALKTGAFDYLTKPVDLKAFRAAVRQAWLGSAGKPGSTVEASSHKAPASGSSPPKAANDAIARIIGTSQPMMDVKARIAKVARSMAPVLVRGESGTGKELVARAVHACSHRHAGPFIAVNCSAIPESLLESEFFGSRKGSFTGAASDRPGFFQAAAGGTLFLDEIGDLPLAMQSKLLRAVQERRVRAVGATTEDPVDVRIVSATHKDLASMVSQAAFRQDLYYRINVIELTLPPLRQRRSDLPALCDALLARIEMDSGQTVGKLSTSASMQLQGLQLNGNVRELENVLHRAVALSEGPELELQEDNLCPPATEAPISTGHAIQAATIPSDLQRHLDDQERQILEQVLRSTDFNRTSAAQKLGISLRQIRYRIERLGIAVSPESGDG